jgi:hypothetical protein
MSSAGLGIKNDCASEDQQQFTLPTNRALSKKDVEICEWWRFDMKNP